MRTPVIAIAVHSQDSKTLNEIAREVHNKDSKILNETLDRIYANKVISVVDICESYYGFDAEERDIKRDFHKSKSVIYDPNEMQ